MDSEYRIHAEESLHSSGHSRCSLHSAVGRLLLVHVELLSKHDDAPDDSWYSVV